MRNAGAVGMFGDTCLQNAGAVGMFGGDMLAKCRRCGDVKEDFDRRKFSWEGWGESDFGDFACSCVPACVLLLSHFDFDFEVWILPWPKGRDACKMQALWGFLGYMLANCRCCDAHDVG